MTAKADFTEEEWNVVREGPAAAGMIVLMAHSGGSFRETWALAKTYAEAQKQPGSSPLIDEIVSERPDVERYHSAEEQEQHGLAGIREAVGLRRAEGHARRGRGVQDVRPRRGNGESPRRTKRKASRSARPSRPRSRRSLQASGRALPSGLVVDDLGPGHEVGQAATALVEQHRDVTGEERHDRNHRSHGADDRSAQGRRAALRARTRRRRRRMPGVCPRRSRTGRSRSTQAAASRLRAGLPPATLGEARRPAQR